MGAFIQNRLMSFRRRNVKSPEQSTLDDESIFSQPPSYWYNLDLRRNTRARSIFALCACAAYFLSFIFLLLVSCLNVTSFPQRSITDH